LDSFEKGLEWARQRDEFESECLSHGQLGTTYRQMGMKEQAI
jgi:hypothetical protein